MSMVYFEIVSHTSNYVSILHKSSCYFWNIYLLKCL